jgi:PPK2 family polyphosphate:nucleotide phosphotransferase
MSKSHVSGELRRAGPDLSLADIDTTSTPGFADDKQAGTKALAVGAATMFDLQERLFAQSRFGGKSAFLLMVQAMDAAGKGGIVQHVGGQITPEGLKVFGFKAPTDEEKKHDFLWRIAKQLPPPGFVGIFDRSHYEDVLIHRVHGFSPPDVIEARYGQIVEFEKGLVDGGTAIVKVMLHVSQAEQKRRLMARLTDPTKNWKYNPGDVTERVLWPKYMEAYEIAINRTSTDTAPWYVIPADKKWYARVAVQKLIINALGEMKLDWPTVDYDPAVEIGRLSADS